MIIKEKRIAKNMTQKDLAAKLNKKYNCKITDILVSRWENGHTEPSGLNFMRLSDILDITLKEFNNYYKKD